MPSRPASSSSRSRQIERLDYKPGGRPLLDHHEPNHTQNTTTSRDPSAQRSIAGSFFSEVAEGIANQDREAMRKNVQKCLSFAWALINTLGAGGITAYSLYAPLFQTRLHYSQLQVNGVSITAMLSLYLPVPVWGMLCDRRGPGVCSLIAGVLFGIGYTIAAFTYRSGPPISRGGEGWPYWVMILGFIPIGSGTSCMYLSAVVSCAKNFGRGKYKGIAMAMPIACFGLSGMWQSQFGSQVLYERLPSGRKGDVDVHRYFLFLAVFLLIIGTLGYFVLKVVDEEELIEDAIDELEQSGLLDDNDEVYLRLSSSRVIGYGTTVEGERRLSVEEIDDLRRKAQEEKIRREELQLKKTWLLNEETRRFLADRTTWWLAAGFFLVSGPGEAFINNLGTVIGTLYPPPDALSSGSDGEALQHTSAATHVSIVAITSTIARILTGTITDLLAPSSLPHQHRRGPNSLANSTTSLLNIEPPKKRFTISRITILITFSLLMSFGQIFLASGLAQNHGDRFWIVSVFIGFGYGAIFSLTPICCSVIWGVENFGTNWGIVATAPAFGATLWGLVYSGVYQAASEGVGEDGGDALCYGKSCYALTFWAMGICVWVACGCWIWAWRGPDGWLKRGIAV